MAESNPDPSMEHDGVPLAGWLWRLVDADRAVRHAAGEAIHALWMATLTDPAEAQDAPGSSKVDPDRFGRAVRAAVASLGFDTAEFVRRLSAFRLALGSDWLRRVDESVRQDGKRDDQYDRLGSRLVDTINTSGDEAAKAHAIERFARLTANYIGGTCKPGADPFAGAESISPAGIASGLIFGFLGPELLAAPEVLPRLLDDRKRGGDALEALARIGPAGLAFAPRLIARLDRLPQARDPMTGGTYFEGAAAALGSIGRGDPGVVDAIVRRLEHADGAVRAAAALVVRHLGIDVCGQEAEIVDRLWPMLDHPETRYEAVFALAAVGRHQPRVRQYLLDRARPRPPVWRHPEGKPEWRYDAVMWERGTAITALEFLTEYPAECVPVLIDAIGTFEEYDSDLTYGGPHARVANALKAIGPAAGPAAVPLAEQLGRDPDADFPRDILDALAALGPAAADALPQLEAFRIKTSDDEPLPDLNAGPVDPTDDPVGAVIQQIRGLTT